MTSRDEINGGSPPDHLTSYLAAPPTTAAFSPATLSASTPSRSARRSTILVHQKSPLLLATPPQITRALAYSHPFVLPLNTFFGLLTWSTGDAWQSFLLLCGFWAVVLYGDVVVRWAGPIVVGMALIGGMYGRRYSPLSSSGWNEPARDLKDSVAKAAAAATGSTPSGASAENGTPDRQGKHLRGNSEVTNTKHQKTLDEIVETLKELTARCNALMEPLLEMTDFLSTQRTPTSATTKPALTAMFVRLLIVTPFWIALAAPPWRIVTTRRVVLVAGTIALTWHARVMRVSRTILWRSGSVRRLASAITGLQFQAPQLGKDPYGAAHESLTTLHKKGESELTRELRRPSQMNVKQRKGRSSRSAGVKFTFIIYENQRRWVGLGWTNSLFAYERPAWSDENYNAVPPKDEFELPDVEDGANMRWRWAPGSRWKVDGVADDHGPVDYDGEEGKNGWIYYDSKWQNGRRGADGWGRWTRRRKWYRDAELVEADGPEIHEQPSTPTASTPAVQTNKYSTAGEKMLSPMRSEPALPLMDTTTAENRPSTSDSKESRTAVDDAASVYSTSSKSWSGIPGFRKNRPGSVDSKRSRRRATSDVLSEEDEDHLSGLGIEVEMELQKQGKDGGTWGIGDEARMSLE